MVCADLIRVVCTCCDRNGNAIYTVNTPIIQPSVDRLSQSADDLDSAAGMADVSVISWMHAVPNPSFSYTFKVLSVQLTQRFVSSM